MVTIRRCSPAQATTIVRPSAIPNDGVDWPRTLAAMSSTSAMKIKQTAKIAELRQALVDQGLFSLGQQAAALGLSRSTTWHVLNGYHKSSGLSAAVVKRMLSSPQLPPNAKRIIENYIQEKLAGAYGHNKSRVRIFRAQLHQSDDITTTG
jgi:hypothetical protein